MLRKTSLHEIPKKVLNTENEQIHCTVCKSYGKSSYFLCKSGRHVICESCKLRKAERRSKAFGDNVIERNNLPKFKRITKSNHYKRELNNFGSGDNFVTAGSTHSKISIIIEEANENLVMITSTPNVSSLTTPRSDLLLKSISKNTISVKNEIPADIKQSSSHLNGIEITLKYKNDNYKESVNNATVNSIISNNLSNDETLQSCDHRPVMCPVTKCATIVTISSIPHHFNFDHAKVPKTLLYKTEPQEVVLNYLTLSSDVKCVTFFLISRTRNQTMLKQIESRCKINFKNSSRKVLLLMAAKVQTISLSKTASRLFTKNSVSQFEDTRNSIHNQPNKSSACRNFPINMNDDEDEDDDEVILLWLCKLDHKDRFYSIMLTRDDKKQGYSYTGNAVNIRRNHTPMSIYSSGECLSVSGTAVNKLMSIQNDLKIIVARNKKVK